MNPGTTPSNKPGWKSGRAARRRCSCPCAGPKPSTDQTDRGRLRFTTASRTSSPSSATSPASRSRVGQSAPARAQGVGRCRESVGRASARACGRECGPTPVCDALCAGRPRESAGEPAGGRLSDARCGCRGSRRLRCHLAAPIAVPSARACRMRRWPNGRPAAGPRAVRARPVRYGVTEDVHSAPAASLAQAGIVVLAGSSVVLPRSVPVRLTPLCRSLGEPVVAVIKGSSSLCQCRHSRHAALDAG